MYDMIFGGITEFTNVFIITVGCIVIAQKSYKTTGTPQAHPAHNTGIQKEKFNNRRQ